MTYIPSSSAARRRDRMAMIKLLMPVVFLLLIGAHFQDFVIMAIKGNLAVNSGIIVTAAYGVCLIVARMLSARKDLQALDHFSHETLSGVDMITLLHEDWLRNSPIRQYLEPIAQTGGMLASSMDQNAIENELAALSEEYNSKLELPQFLVGFMIAMGLLGTFVGLLETLTGISGMLDGMGQTGTDVTEQFSKLVVELRKPLSGMGMAFSASMFGLITSLMLSIMMIALRRYINSILGKARTVMHELTQRVSIGASSLHGYARNMGGDASGDNPPALPSPDNTAGQKNLINEMIEKNQKSMDQVVEGLGALVKRMDALLERAPSMEIMASGTAFGGDGNGASMSDEQSMGILKALSLLQHNQQQLLQKVIGSLVEIDQKFLVMLSSGATQKTQSDQIFDVTRRLTNKLEDIASSLGSIQEGALSIGSIFDKGLTPLLLTLREGTATQQQVAMRIDEMHSSNQNIDRHLLAIKEGFIRASSSFGMIDSIADSVSRQTVLFDTSIEDGRNAQRVFVSVLQRELRNFLGGLSKLLGITPPEEPKAETEKQSPQ